MKRLSWCIMISASLMACQPKIFNAKWTIKRAPSTFRARFETTQGPFEITAKRQWSPAGVDRLYQLIKYGYYEDMAVFRVIPGKYVQFGISGDSLLNTAWNQYPIRDELVRKKNTLGTIAFAHNGPSSRSTQIFINIGNNSPRLDTLMYKDVKGFPVVAEVVSGLDNLLDMFAEYGEEPMGQLDSLYRNGNPWMQRSYPEMDYIERAYILEDLLD